MIDAKKLVAVVLVGGIGLLLAVMYLRLVAPAAAREAEAACRGLERSARWSVPPNKAYPRFPSTKPIAASFTAQDHTGKSVSLSDFAGKVVLVNFWATWCDVCKAEKPSLEKLQRELGGDDFEVVAVASDDDWEKIQKAFPKGTPLKILLDPPKEGENLGPIAQAYGITAVPESFVIDKRGIIQHYFINKRDWSSSVATTCIQSLMDE